MATYVKADLSLNSSERMVVITDVEAGDRIILEDVLGRSARGVRFHMTDSTDTLEGRLNSMVKRTTPTRNDLLGETINVWLDVNSFSVTGTEVFDTLEGLKVSSVEITDLTLSTGTTIEMTVW